MSKINYPLQLTWLSTINKETLLDYARRSDKSLLTDKEWKIIPETFKTDPDIIRALLKKGILRCLSIHFPKLITYEMCKESVRIRPDSFNDVPVELMSEELVELYFLLSLNTFTYLRIDRIPEKFMNKERYLLAVHSSGINLKDIPEHNIDEEIRIVAVMSYSEMMDWIPENFQSDKLCWAAINKNPRTIQYIKNPTKDMCLEALSKDEVLIDRIKKFKMFNNNEQDVLNECIDYTKRKYLMESL